MKISTVTELGGLGATYAVHLRLIGQLVGDFRLVTVQLFSLGAFVLSQYMHLTDRQNLDSNTVHMLRSRTVIIRPVTYCVGQKTGPFLEVCNLCT